MKRLCTVLMFLACVSFCALVFGDDELAPNGGRLGAVIPPGIEISSMDVTVITGSSVILGVQFVNGSYWLTAAGITDSTEPENYLYKVSKNGVLEASFVQPTVSRWGWRDLASDGAYLYASDSSVIDQISMQTGQKTGVTIPSPTDPARALSYDPTTGHFWVANWSSDLYEIDRNGQIIHQFPNAHSLYGMGLDIYSRNGPYLWGWHQDDSADAAQIQASTGIPTGWEFRSTVPGIAGGMDVSAHVVPGKLVAIAVGQNHGADTITLYDITPEGGVVPTMSSWGLAMVALLTLFLGLFIIRKRA